MSIEQATIDDAQEILALQKLAYTSEAEIYDCTSSARVRKKLFKLSCLRGTIG